MGQLYLLWAPSLKSVASPLTGDSFLSISHIARTIHILFVPLQLFLESFPMSSNGNKKKTDSPNATAMTQHPKYHIADGDLRICIGSTEFKIHSYFFTREATAFFPPTTSTNEASSPDRSDGPAIILENVSVSEFERFLWVFYNEDFNIYDTTLTEWLVIFKLASRWGFSKVEKFSLGEIRKYKSDFSFVDWIVTFEQHEASKNILLPLFAKLCIRDTSITDEEIAKLSPERCIQIFRIREEIRSPGGRSPVPTTLKEREIFPTVARLLGLAESPRPSNGE
ncbi:hypothetical protein FA15DRAFT_619725 [Coprinopsis marcescibilis]|uniref:BTB domain-containing protein n=1 Tax=Coprinopsis marcescibilis TaxID=230819 RepID=A0A5C3KU57_COPMA|nr:hypothetical protein FA15DRAFT_619725 [Coprinopsis marcescibilis]